MFGEKSIWDTYIAYNKDDEIYITDTATTGEQKGIGTVLLMNLMQSVTTDSNINIKVITMNCRGQTSARAVSKDSSRRTIESMTFTDDQGNEVMYRVDDPTYEEVMASDPGRLMHFAFVPTIVPAT